MEQVIYSRYPLSKMIVYNALTFLHYILGFIGIMHALSYSGTGKITAVLYLAFAFIQMYVVMPLMVCRYCVYLEEPEGRCISGLNLIARRIFSRGNADNFQNRSKGILCPNNLYLTAKVLPLLIMIPFIIVNFSFTLLLLFMAVLGLLLFRIFYVFPQIACGHCLAKDVCPNAKKMGLSSSTN